MTTNRQRNILNGGTNVNSIKDSPLAHFSKLTKPLWALNSSTAPELPAAAGTARAEPAELVARAASAPPRAPAVWRDQVKSVYASLKAVDPSTSYKEAMTHAKASWTKY